MLLPWEHQGLFRSHRFDAELAELADRHYSRQKVGSPQFVAPGKNLVYRDKAGLVVFVWLWQLPEFRDDKQEGYCCSMFHNESDRLSSSIILEAEGLALREWGASRVFTYVNPKMLRISKCRGLEYCPLPVGRCFLEAGWRFVKTMPDGKRLLEKWLTR